MLFLSGSPLLMETLFLSDSESVPLNTGQPLHTHQSLETPESSASESEPTSLSGTGHQTVLLEQAIDALVTDPEGLYIDGTFGRGGHSRALLQRLGAKGRVLAIDKDPEAISVGQELAQQDARFHIEHASFTRLEQLAEPGRVCGILLDLGVSSPQLDQPERGFSFSQDGPLDMRMDNSKGLPLADWLATAKETDIADVLYQYGEERYSRRIAKAIVLARQQAPLHSTLQLADIIKQAHPKWEKHKHPATRSFQGLRIFINRELDDLDQALASSVDVLQHQGRLVVISFHSLEDRRVKHFIRLQEQGVELPKTFPVQTAHTPKLRALGKAIKPSAEQITDNVRARSAVMRVAVRTDI